MSFVSVFQLCLYTHVRMCMGRPEAHLNDCSEASILVFLFGFGDRFLTQPHTVLTRWDDQEGSGPPLPLPPQCMSQRCLFYLASGGSGGPHPWGVSLLLTEPSPCPCPCFNQRHIYHLLCCVSQTNLDSFPNLHIHSPSLSILTLLSQSPLLQPDWTLSSSLDFLNLLTDLLV